MFLRLSCFTQRREICLLLFIFLFAFIVIFSQYKYLKLNESKIALESVVLRLENEIRTKLGEERESSRDEAGGGDILIYNRVPKTASTSFVNVAYDLCKRNGFNVLHLNITGNLHVMSLSDQARFIRNITQWTAKRPGLYHGHVAFINFEKFGVRDRPIYINLLRRPLDRLVSYYYFLRYGDNYRPHLIRKKHGDTMTFDDCVKAKQADCDPSNMWLQIPFLCGHSPQCWEVGSSWALEEAKKNLVEKYLLVGLTEQLPDFISVLEATLPRFFSGASRHFKSSKKAHLRKTNVKIDPSEETVNEIKKSQVWAMENELYEYAAEHFEFIKRRFVRARSGELTDRGQQFMFEKISPKGKAGQKPH